jgi:hypothetical protein
VLNIGHVAHGKGRDAILDAAVKLGNVHNDQPILDAFAQEHSG